MTERIGQCFGNYRLIRLLGEGGFAEVYLGKHLHLGTLVAVKVLHTKLIMREQEEFLREARTIASLEHPSIVRVLDCGIEAERKEPFIIMHYAAHGTLRQRYPKGTRLAPSSLLPYLKQIASALHYAHNAHFIHRDVKPENILLGTNDEALLSDFGIALISSSSSSQSTKAAAGTVAYMAPEQILGKPRAASDQYALGIVVYEWLSGTTPFHGSFSEMCAQHLYASPPSLCEIVPWLSPEVEQVILKALSKEAQDRFATILDFANTLEQNFELYHASLLADEAPGILDDPPMRLADEIQSDDFIARDTAGDALENNINAILIDQDEVNAAPDDLLMATLAAPSVPDEALNDPFLATIAASDVPATSSQASLTPIPGRLTRDAFLPGNDDLPSSTDQGSMSPQPVVRASSVPATPIPITDPALFTTRRQGSGLHLVSLVTLVIAALLIISTFGYLTISRAANGTNQNSASLHITPTTPPTPASTQEATQLPVDISTPQPTTAPASPPATVPASQPTTPSTSQPVQRLLSAVQTASQTVNATGQGQTQGTHATGILTFKNFDQSKTFTFTSGEVFYNDQKIQISMMIESKVILPPGTTRNVSAHVVEIGTIGNIAGSGFGCCQEDPFTIINNTAFSGGTDPQSYTSVQQSDITNAASPLIASTTSQAQADIQNQIRPSEHLLKTPQCNSHTSANHEAGDEATTVTVTVKTTCTATAST